MLVTTNALSNPGSSEIPDPLAHTLSLLEKHWGQRPSDALNKKIPLAF